MVAKLPQLPFPRSNVLELAPLYDLLRRESAITEVITPAGDPAWLVTGFEEVKQLLSDPRLGRSHPHPKRASRMSTAAIQDGPIGDYETEQEDHARFRRLLTPSFSVKRMRQLSGKVQALTDGYIDRLIEEHESSGIVDLHKGLALPLPVAVICQLLGVPEKDSDLLRSLSTRMATFSADGDALRAYEEFSRYLEVLADAKRADPSEDVVTDIVQAQAADEDFDHDYMVLLIITLLFAGHETTVNRIGLGTLMLLTQPEQWEALVADPAGRVDATVEEIVRLGAPGSIGILRYAHADLEIGGVAIKNGELVILSNSAANRDPSAFTDPDEFDPDREERLHLGFGYGGRFCIGAALARIELRVVFTTLAQRLPGLRLAIDLDGLEVRPDHIVGGLTTLPVTW
jgi:cytochrome P450